MLRRAKQEVSTVGVTGKIVTGSHHIPVTSDSTAEDLQRGGDMDMFVLPGGMPGTTNLAKSPAVEALMRRTLEHGGRAAAICAAPTVLAELGLLEGRRATCYPGMEPEMCGAVMQNAGVVRDGNFITGRAAGSAFAFGLALVEALCGAETAARIAAQVVWIGEEASHD